MYPSSVASHFAHASFHEGDLVNDGVPATQFASKLRPSQQEVVDIARRKLADGGRRLHIVAPPGSGKTVLGLYLWAELVRRPALVLSPTSAIQAQWTEATRLFGLDPQDAAVVSRDPAAPGALTSLTYQSLTIARRGDGGLEAAALAVWRERLLEKGQAQNEEEARLWIEDLERHNATYYERRLAAYRKEVRDQSARGGDALATLHASSRAALERLRERGVGLIILDECHHLLGHWGRVLHSARGLFDEVVTVGLTATPPDPQGRHSDDVERYEKFFGPVDYEVPVPAVVRDGFLAPYQDLAYLVRPTADELSFVAGADRRLHALVDTLSRGEAPGPELTPCAESLVDWLTRALRERRLPAGTCADWSAFERRDPALAMFGPLFLERRGVPLPKDVPPSTAFDDPAAVPALDVYIPVLDRYVRHRLRRSEQATDHTLGDYVIAELRTLGVQVTETGTQACASPVGRVLAYSQAKAEALTSILRRERAVLGENVRAVVVADYERTSAVAASIAHLLDEEAGGAVAAFRALLGDAETDALDPVLVTGSTILVDDDLVDRFLEACNAWLRERNIDVTLSDEAEAGFHLLLGRGADWCPQIYVAMLTELFQRGLTRCLVGTRGLLGEGWDASRLNVLVDLTTVTTSMTVNQLRGRSIRLDPQDPKKVADNWDVVCIAPEFAKGLDDYARLRRKHRSVFGVTDDGVIERGVGHVHAAFTELRPVGLEGTMAALNEEMLDRAARRDWCRQLWRIGEPYHPEPVAAVEVSLGGGGGGFPPFTGADTAWSDASLTLAFGRAILGALREAGLLQSSQEVQVTERTGGYVRAFLEGATEEDGEIFQAALHDALGPLRRPRYVVPRSVQVSAGNWITRLLPRIVARYFERRRTRRVMLHAVPGALSKNKRLVAIYQRHWNAHVSPGEAVYAHHGRGEALVSEARREGWAPRSEVHDKHIFQ